jgi:three-Cys-motif partner protein
VTTQATWISDETELKESDFRGILSMHVTICKGIMSRSARPPYLYADLYAGPGNLEHKGSEFLGSPLIAQEELARAGIPCEAIHFERDAGVADRLREALWVPRSVTWWPDPDNTHVFTEPCQEGFARWLSQAGHQRNRLGLIYSDPINDEIPHRLLSKAAAMLPKTDILTYVAATQYKRRRGVDSSRPFLSDHIRAIGKKVVLIRRPHTAWHWTFILLSNWVDLPQWQKRGFYRLESETGTEIMRQLDLSSREHRELVNTPLPFDEVPYRTYDEYLRHPRFLKIRAEVFTRAAGTCERCRSRPPTEPHHLRYPPWGTFDVPENMIAVCHPCHCEIHGKAT